MDISSLLEVEVKEGKPSELHANGEIAAYKNMPDFSIRDIASVRFRKLHCTGCDVHIGSAPAQAHNMHEHPVLHVLLCTNCRNFYGDGTFEQGDDATDMFCRWCANGGNLYCCSYCSNTFCYACIKRNFDPLVRKKIERDEKWKCFVCNPADLYSARAACWALLQHVQTVNRILQTDRKMNPEEIEAKMNLDESQCCPHKRKRSDTPSDDEFEDETYTVPKRKRRKVLNARRAKRRLIKLEMAEGGSESSTTEHGPRQPNSNRVGNDESYFVQSPGNNSEPHSGNDESPKDIPVSWRKKGRRLRSGSSNRSTDTERSQQMFAQDDEIPPPLLQCDQTMIEGAESLSFGVTSPVTRDNNPSSSTPKPGITPVPTANLLKRPSTGLATRGGREHRIIRSVSGAPLLVRKLPHLLPNIPRSGNNVKTGSGLKTVPMVTIPSRNHISPSSNRINVMQPSLQPAALVRNPTGGFLKQIRPHIVLAQPISNPNIANITTTVEPPSVINLDSEDDDIPNDAETTNDPTISESSNDRVSELSTTTYPVRPDDGFMTILTSTTKDTSEQTIDLETNDGDSEQIPKQSLESFERAIRGPTQSIDTVIDSLKNKLKRVVQSPTVFPPDKQLIAAKAKTRTINRTIKRTVAELTSLSDNLISAYRDYKRQCTNQGANHTPSITLKKTEKSNKFIPLDMKCTRESEPDSEESPSEDDDGGDGDDSDNSQDIRPIREIRAYRWRVSRAVDARPETADKSVQAYDVVTADYEKSIGYALLLKADYDAKRERDILSPVMVPDKNFGKYENEFIDYLQYIEDRRNNPDSTMDDDFTFNSVNDLVEADITIARRTNEKSKIINSDDRVNDDEKRANNDDNVVEILDEHLEISIPTNSLHTSSSDGASSSSNSEMENSETTLSDKNKPGIEIGETKIVEKFTIEVDDIGAENVRNYDPEPIEIQASKEITRRNDEETVLAVRALVDEDNNDNDTGKVGTNTCQTIESDDECTVLD